MVAVVEDGKYRLQILLLFDKTREKFQPRTMDWITLL
jgi:hypothetical protein